MQIREKHWVGFPFAVVMIFVVLCCSTSGFLCERSQQWADGLFL